MARLHSFIKPTPGQAQELNMFLKGGYARYGLRARRRVQAVWFSSQGKTVEEITQRLRICKASVWKWFKAYQAKGIEGLKGKYCHHALRRKGN